MKTLINVITFGIFLLIFVDCDGFMWGISTAAYQIEGSYLSDGKSLSIWDTFTHIDGKIYENENGDVADMSYLKFSEDIILIKDLGLNYYRFSLSWSRIMPTENGVINPLGIEHYNKLINLLIEAKIQPVVTLYHWDLPLWIENSHNGWLDRKIIENFVVYAEACFHSFGDRVKWWITINEPWTFALNGYGTGVFAPGRCSDRSKCTFGNSSTESYIVAHNVLLSHAYAVKAYRDKYQTTQNGQISITLNMDWAEPFSNATKDIEAAQIRNEFSIGWFADPIYFGQYPLTMQRLVGSRLPQFTEEEQSLVQGSVDFFALNHYSTKYAIAVSPQHGDGSVGWVDDQGVDTTNIDRNGSLIGAQAGSPWLNVVPWGFYKVLQFCSERYNNPMIMITENGCDIAGEDNWEMPQALNDSFRINYLKLYLEQLDKARSDGINVFGYFAWSLMDNFEWVDGYHMRFGLYRVDYDSPNRTRYAKLSSHWYKEYTSSMYTASTFAEPISSYREREDYTMLQYLQSWIFSDSVINYFDDLANAQNYYMFNNFA